jgi:hypothetical protein
MARDQRRSVPFTMNEPMAEAMAWVNGEMGGPIGDHQRLIHGSFNEARSARFKVRPNRLRQV